MKIIAVSGYFNPVHIGHIKMFQEAKALGDKLVVIINNDNQIKLKGSAQFMTEQDRLFIIKNLKPVDDAVISIDQDKSVRKTLEMIRPHIFANGGDRKADNIPEYKLCDELGIEMVFNVGGGKIRSSSELISKSKPH